jgi:hypothetical protein
MNFCENPTQINAKVEQIILSIKTASKFSVDTNISMKSPKNMVNRAKIDDNRHSRIGIYVLVIVDASFERIII